MAKFITKLVTPLKCQRCGKQWQYGGKMKIGTEDLRRFNEIVDELEKDLFFEHYVILMGFYEYLAVTYQFDLKTHTVDPSSGEIVPIGSKQGLF